MLLQVDPVQLPAEADQRTGGPADVPDPLQQPAPAAQRPGSSQMPDRLLHQRPQARLAAVDARCPSLSRSSVERFPERPSRAWVVD
jgi:hypothetical protein